jgi:hypothetical protein
MPSAGIVILNRKNTPGRHLQGVAGRDAQPVLGYTLLDDRKDGSYGNLDINVASKDMKIQARKGYYALKPGTE